jgi:lipopolysaccharide exporter
MSGLAQQGVRAVKWSAVSTLARFALQLGAQVVLARLLGPENYGIFGIGMVVLTLSNFLANFGFGWNLLHKQDLTSEDIRFAFTWQVVAGTTAMLALFFLAPTLADYFREPRVLPVIRWLSLACLLSAATSPASNLLQRDLNFKAVGLVQVGSYACGYVLVGIPMALMGQGVNALVAAWLVQVGVALVAMYTVRRHPVRPLFQFSGSGKAMGTSGQVFMTNVVNWFLNNIDRVLIGRMLNAHAVGLYTAGYNLATMPNTLLLGALQPAFMSAAARMQTDRQRLGRAYLEMLSTVWVLALPFFVFLASISFDLVRFLYGPKWAETAGVLAILFLGMPAYVTWGLTTPVLWNTERKHHEALLQLPVLLIGGAALYWSLQWGVLAAAAAASGMLVLRMLVVCGSAFQALGLRCKEVWPHLGRGLLLSCAVIFAVAITHYLLGDWVEAFGKLVFCGISTLCVIAGTIYIYPDILGHHVLSMAYKFFPSFNLGKK